MARHIAWRDDIARTCICGHDKGAHAIGGRCLTFSVPLVDGQPGCPCQAFESAGTTPPDEDEGKGRDG